MKSSLIKLAALLVAGSTATVGFAQIAQVNPFAGTYSENFDEFPSQQQQLFLPNPLTTFGGEGLITITNTNPNAVMAMAVYNGVDNPYGNYMPQSGDQFVVTQYQGDVVNITFNDAMSEFGGYFGQDGLTVNFLDANGNVIGGGAYNPTSNNGDGTLEWLGWSSTQAFTTVQIADTDPNAFAVVMDSLQATPTPAPEPCTVGLLIGGVVMAARKKKASSRQ